MALTGLVAGVGATVAFGVIHAVLITPIWTRLIGGLPLAAIAATALAFTLDSVEAARGRSSTVTEAALLGLSLFIALLPATLVDVWMRKQGLRLGDTGVGMAAAILLFAGAGYVVGWIRSRSHATGIVCTAAVLALMAASGGPLPLGRSIRGAALSLGIGGIAIATAVLVALTRPRVDRLLDSSSDRHE